MSADPPQLKTSLPRAAYTSQEHFTTERERILFSQWFCIGRDESLTQPGDYLHSQIAGEDVLVVRTKSRDLRAFYNVCRHRGCALVLQDAPQPGRDIRASGRFTNSIRCPYHSWTYGLEGDLRHARFLEGLDKAQLSLHPIGCEAWGGFVFVHLEPERATSLSDHLGGVTDRLTRYPLTELRTNRRKVYDVATNWKVVLENYNECYHCGPVHPELCELVPAFKESGGGGLDWEDGIEHREGAWTFTESGTTDRAPFDGLSDEERTRHKGELVYPNLLLSLSADHVASFTLWPRDATHTTIICDFLFHPDEIEKPGFDPSDAVDFWDTVNHQDWAICEGVQKGMGSRRFTSGYMAPMEDDSADITRYVNRLLGDTNPD